MAASDTHIFDLLVERVAEEVARAERQHAPLSCLLVSVDGLDAIARTYGKHLSEQALAYVGLALRREFRRYDRVGPADAHAASAHDYLVVLPGADGAQGEVIARRTLARLRAIKIETHDEHRAETHGERRALSVAVSIATWREGLTAGELIAQARTAAGRGTAEQSSLSSAVSSDPSSSLPSGPLGFRDALRI
jgi:GGDEF domain-containing protein